MQHSIRRVLAIVVLIAALAPAALLAQTPVPVTNESNPSIVHTDLGVTVMEETGQVHFVKRLDIDAGAAIPTLNDLPSVVITVQEGQLLVTTEGGRPSGSVGTGDAIQTDDGEVVCEKSTCLLEADQPVVIGTGNGLAISGGSIDMDTSGDEPVVALISVLISEERMIKERCWICPVVIP